MENQSAHPHTLETVGHAFVKQYYGFFCQPEVLHRFYHESSVLSRPEPDGKALKTVTTLQDINSMILSLDYNNYDLQILSADYQFSLNGGVIILVTGHLTGKDNVQRKFTQTFFLAPQDTGFFVLNDIFKYVDGVVENIVVDQSTPEASLAPNHVVTEPSAVADQPELNQTTSVEVNNTNGKELNNTHGKESINVLENGQETVTENSVVAENPVESRQNVAPQVTEAAASNTQKDAPKKSFASVVNALNGNNAPFIMRTRPTKPVERPHEPVTPEVLPPQNNSAPEKNNVPAGKSYAIFVAKLPMNATVEELEKVFKQFGPIKRDGIQVRSNKQQGTCFGFVEFESAKAMQTALENVSSTMIFEENRRWQSIRFRTSTMHGTWTHRSCPKGGSPRINKNASDDDKWKALERENKVAVKEKSIQEEDEATLKSVVFHNSKDYVRR